MYLRSRYLNPTIDFAFKRVFGEHKHLLISFLNAMLPLPDDAPIDSLEYLPPEHVPELPGFLKYSIVDVKCTDALGRTFIVEMQIHWSTHFERRILFSASQAYVKQLGEGQDYAELGPVYALAITNSVFAPDDENYYHHYRIVKTEPPERVLKGLEFVFIELTKFKPKTRTDRLMQVKWLQFLSEVGKDDAKWDAVPEADRAWRNDANIAQALRLVESAALTRAELDQYHHHQDQLRTASMLLKDKKNEGLVEGEAIGLEKGKAEGKAEGAREAVLAIARSLVHVLSDEAIAASTGLSVADVAALR
jgi:predicted transposase/invertase (TIGR01784 family)